MMTVNWLMTMKRLDGKEEKQLNNETGKNYIYVTPTIMTKKEAIDKKEKQINYKLFGKWAPVEYKLQSTKEVLVPYCLFEFSYEVNKKEDPTRPGYKGKFYKIGETGIVYDMNEVHGFHFDTHEKLKLKKLNLENNKWEVLQNNCSDEEAHERALLILKTKILRRVYRNVTGIKVAKKTLFYRRALELTYECRGNTYIKYAYMDEYSQENEHVSGIKARIN